MTLRLKLRGLDLVQSNIGSVGWYKVRLVTKGNTQTYKIDYQETFAYVVKMNSIRIPLSLIANCDWSLQQIDAKMLFFIGTWNNKSSWMYLLNSRDNLRTRTCVSWKSLYMAWISPWGIALKDLLSPLWYLDICRAKENILCSSNGHKKKGWLFLLFMMTL